MSCEKIMEMLSLYIDNELNEQESNEIEKHLKTCEECSREYEDLLAIKKLLSETPQVELPLGFKEELHQKLVECSTEDNNKIIDFKEESKKVRSKKKYNWKVLSGIAAGILLTVVSVSSLINNDFSTKEFGQMESEKAAPQESAPAPLNIAMEEAKDSGMAAKEAPAEGYGNEKINKSEMNYATDNRMTDIQSDEIKEKIEIAGNKIILNGNLQLQVEDYDSIYNKVVNLVTSKQGFVQNSYTSYKDSNTSNNEKSLKTGNIVLRVPKNEFESTYDEIKNMGVISDQNINSYDIAIEYSEAIAMRENLMLQEKELREMLDKTQDEKEVSEIEGKLGQVMSEIDILAQEILRLDDLVALSTIDVYLDEEN